MNEENIKRLEEYNKHVEETLDKIKELAKEASALEDDSLVEDNSVVVKAVWADLSWMRDLNNQ